ncbi:MULTISPECIES: hypothetical protein [unclassified Thiocapsa]|uniref:hypothetical protein n=1 Tax=unclassified Thiocapsa TaxID=2641286 RepID=UPI0035B28D84
MSLTLFVDGELYAVDDSSGFILLETDEALATRLFVEWFRAERRRLDREDAAAARRMRIRLVPPHHLED